jgi:hypothetical protein
MCFQKFALGRQCAVDERSILQERIEHGYQRALMIVPSETKLLIIVHGGGTG